MFAAIRPTFACWLALVTLLPLPGEAQTPVAVLDPIRIDPQGQGFQFTFDGLAFQDDGSFIVVWYGAGEDLAYDVFGRRFDTAGSGGERFQINTYTPGRQWEPAIAVGEQGEFVVVWGAYTLDDPDQGVSAQRFDASATPIGTEFQVNVATAGPQFVAHVGALPDGEFVVVWDSGGYAAPFEQIYGRRFDADAQATGSEFAVAESAAGDPKGVRVAVAEDGRSLMSWWQHEGAEAGYDVFARMYDAGGNAAGSSFRVNASTPDVQWTPTAVALADGSFIVAWTSWGGQDGDGTGIFARSVDASGAPAGTEFQINAYATGSQYNNAIATLGDDKLVVAWTGAARGGDGVDAVVRVFGADGEPLTDDVLVSEPHPVTDPVTTTTVGAGEHMYDPLRLRQRGVRAKLGTLTSTTFSTSTTLPPFQYGELSASVAGHDSGRFVVTYMGGYAERGAFAQRFTLNPSCGDADDDGSIDASDALHVLRAAVSGGTCADCVCEVAGAGAVTAADALAILRHAVGTQATLECGACGG